MIEISIDRADLRNWLVCESGQRWVTAIRRFSPELMPRPLVPSIVVSDPQEAIDRLAALPEQRAIMLWESTSGSLLPVFDQLMETSSACPKVLQLVAANGRSAREQAMLLELPCATILRHPEDLPGLRSMIRSYFRNRAG